MLLVLDCRTPRAIAENHNNTVLCENDTGYEMVWYYGHGDPTSTARSCEWSYLTTLIILVLVGVLWTLRAQIERFYFYDDMLAPSVERLYAFFQTNTHVFSVSRAAGPFCTLLPMDTVDSYIERQFPIGTAGILANIGPDGARSFGAKVSWHATILYHQILTLLNSQVRSCHCQSKH